MTVIRWLIIGWLIQTILLLILIYDLHQRISAQRRFFAALTAILKIDIDKILEIANTPVFRNGH